MVKFRLTPNKGDSFFELFEDDAHNLVEAAKLLAELVDKWEDVDAWSRVVPFKIPYYDEEYGFHYYIPDFIVKTNGRYYLVETKGKGFAKQKDTATKQDVAEQWIKKAQTITKDKWVYLFVLDEKFERYKSVNSFDMFVKTTEGQQQGARLSQP